MTRQALWQNKHREAGLCVHCPAKICKQSVKFCLKHMQMRRESERRRSGRVRRNFGASSYQEGKS